MEIPKIKIDEYSKNRKSYSQIYELHCNKCKNLITYYQKDGKGPLNRIYVDRIANQQIVREFSIDKKLICHSCNSLLGLGYIYQKEKRPAYKLFEKEIYKQPVIFLDNLKFIISSFIIR